MSNLIRSVYDEHIVKCKELCNTIVKLKEKQNSQEIEKISKELSSLLSNLERGKIKLLYWI